MQKLSPSLDKANFALKPVRNDARRQLLDLLDTVRGKKALVLEPHFVQPLGLIADALTLKEHGVEMFCVMENQPSVVTALIDRGIRHLVYLLHSRIEAVQAMVAHVDMCRSLGASFDFTVLLMPRRIKACELLLDQAGLLGDVAVKGCSMSWIPLDEDLLSLESPKAFKELAVNGDTSCLWDMAYALTALQASRGAIPHIKGKGHWASAVHKIMARMRREQGPAAPAPGSDGGIDTLILIDRTADLITPMCTQLTYEGLLDEVLGLNYGQIRTSSSTIPSSIDHSTSTGERKVSGLNSADPVFRETRDLFYLGARKWLNETLRSIQQFRDAGMNAADISELKGFVAELRDKFARIPIHTSLVDQLGSALRAPSFSARQRVEAALLNEEDDLASIEDLLIGQEDVGLLHVLRLLCLYCSVHGGIPKRQWDTVRRDLVNTYGPGQLITLRALCKAGMLQRKDNKKSTFPTIKAGMRLLMQEGEVVNEDNPADINFAYAGYAPLSVRIVQQALSSGGWAAADVAMSALPGPQFEIAQTVDDKGLPVEQRVKGGMGKKEKEGPSSGGDPSKRRTVMVAFIGGVTNAEISALRFLSRKGLVDCNFLVATTKVVNGSSLLKTMAAVSEE